MGEDSENPDIETEGPFGNRGGHNVVDNDFIFYIPEGEEGYVAPRKDKID